MIDLLHRLRRFIGRHHSPQFKILVVILVAAAIPLTVYVAQQVQELRQRAGYDDADYACARPGQTDDGAPVGKCEKDGELCTRFNRSVWTDDLNGDGEGDYNDPDDQPYCDNRGGCDQPCSQPCDEDEWYWDANVTKCIHKTQYVKSTDFDGNYQCEDVFDDNEDPDKADCPGKPTEPPIPTNTPTPTETPVEPTVTTSPPTQNTCSTPSNGQFCTTGSCSSHNMVTGTGSCGEAGYNCCRPAATSAPEATLTPIPGRQCRQCTNGTITGNGQGCNSSTPNCESLTTSSGVCMAITTSGGCGQNTPTTTQPTGISPTIDTSAGTLAIKIPLQSIGTGNPSGPQRNTNPQRRTRDVTISFYTANNAPTALTPTTATLPYDTTENLLKGNVNLSTIPAGTYKIRVSMKGALDRKSLALALPTTTSLLFSELLMCNITDDDTVDIQDYSMFTTCFEGKANSQACGSFKQTADCNDDGQVTLEDYVWLFKNLGRQDE